ncbi:NemA protein [Kingella kingae]|uniref:NemA protein n=1 Tax=Kingella kingae TaxID=504 RepID=UPI00254D8BFC|nr:NemA protein [Kingella kingae]MDK4527506.1 NemA protein [Kingella kingae]MDK4542015.1 NemA protein [Kingella kingae]MDK4562006.1 NemA protein [Kingella kingae]MDK4601717.1 NemA protein [Kingella kingae]MDK4631786.1 NemA protein [Kingella kingae]
MKQTILWAAVALGLTACSGVGVNGSGVSLGVGLGGSIGRHVGLGTSINIPLSLDKDEAESKTGGINVVEQKIITYFDAQGKTSDSAVKGGFFRQLLVKQNDNAYLVQDFYDNGNKRSDPMTLAKEHLFEFRAQPKDGTYTVYAINGNIMQQHNFKNGKLVQP